MLWILLKWSFAGFLVLAASIRYCLKQGGVDETNRNKSRRNNNKKEQWSVPSLALATVSDDDSRGKISSLPGLRHNPGFEMYSGYINVTETRHLFYWFVESQGSPAKDPLVLWTNGGPGCSGLIGFGEEHGPFIIDGHGKLTDNPFSWNKIANMIYIEQPAGVGFSYADLADDLTTGDAQAAQDNAQFVKSFLERYPEFQSNPFYISGESYGGHYIPQLAIELLKQQEQQENDDSAAATKLNFQGFLVGNPYADPFSNMVAQLQTAYFHGLLSKPIMDEWDQQCNDPKRWMSGACDKVMMNIYESSMGVEDVYALDYPLCLEDQSELESSIRSTSSELKQEKHRQLENVNGQRANRRRTFSSQAAALMKLGGMSPPFLPKQDVYQPCSDLYTHRYLRRLDVQTALHVRSEASPKNWSDCTDDVIYSMKDVYTPTVPLYEKLVQDGMAGKHNLKMLVFSGDDDSVCATSGTQSWIWDISPNATTDQNFVPWRVEGQTAGFSTTFEMGDKTNATWSFVTVHGAGHEVPACRPMEAFEMFRRFLNEQ